MSSSECSVDSRQGFVPKCNVVGRFYSRTEGVCCGLDIGRWGLMLELYSGETCQFLPTPLITLALFSSSLSHSPAFSPLIFYTVRFFCLVLSGSDRVRFHDSTVDPFTIGVLVPENTLPAQEKTKSCLVLLHLEDQHVVKLILLFILIKLDDRNDI